MHAVPGGLAATTVSTGAIALSLLMSLSSHPVAAESSTEPARVEHLEALLVQHDVRYVLLVPAGQSADCLRNVEERG